MGIQGIQSVTPSVRVSNQPFTTTAKLVVLLAAAGIGMAYAPLLAQHLANLWRRQEFQYFPFVFAAVAGLLWSRWRRASPRPNAARQSSRAWIVGLAVAWLVLAAAGVVFSPILAACSAVFMAGLLIAWLSRGRYVTNRWGIWALLLLVVPPPLNADRQLITRLQKTSSLISSEVLDVIGVNHVMAGNVLRLTDHSLFVDEACSGIVSVMSVIACSAILAVWANRSLCHTLLLIGSGILWALALNVARISTIAFVHFHWGQDWSGGTAHKMLGLVLFLVTLVAVVSTDQLLSFLLQPIAVDTNWYGPEYNVTVHCWNRLVTSFTPGHGDDVTSTVVDQESALERKSTVPVLSTRLLITVAVAFALLGIWQVFAMLGSTAWSGVVRYARQLDESFMPATLCDWELVEHTESTRDAHRGYANCSKVYTYRRLDTGQTMSVSFDFPFAGSWKELSDCYVGSGWTIDERFVQSLANGEMMNEPYVEVDLSSASGKRGFLLFGQCDADGRIHAPPDPSVFNRLAYRIRRGGPTTVGKLMFQSQVWVPASGPITGETKADAREAFAASWARFRTYLRDYDD